MARSARSPKRCTPRCNRDSAASARSACSARRAPSGPALRRPRAHRLPLRPGCSGALATAASWESLAGGPRGGSALGQQREHRVTAVPRILNARLTNGFAVTAEQRAHLPPPRPTNAPAPPNPTRQAQGNSPAAKPRCPGSGTGSRSPRSASAPPATTTDKRSNSAKSHLAMELQSEHQCTKPPRHSTLLESRQARAELRPAPHPAELAGPRRRQARPRQRQARPRQR